MSEGFSSGFNNQTPNEKIGQLILILGLVIAVVGLVIMFWDKIPGSKSIGFGWIGNLPGDVRIEKENFRFYFPFTTCVLASFILTGIMKLVQLLRS